MVEMNAFRVLADVSHTVSKCILIWAIHSNRSTEGVSLLTQLMYMLVFVARYLDLFWVSPFLSLWNFFLKIFYISTSIYILFLMLRVFARTREKEKAWQLSAYVTFGSVVGSPLVLWVLGGEGLFGGRDRLRILEIVWGFSIILEAFCVLPQLILLRQTAVPTVIDSFYLLTLGSYRGFYILNWIWRAAHAERVDKVKVIFGIIQTAFYIDFAWVYWTRQRVKLRGGGIVDSEDLRKGFLVNRFIGQRTSMDEEADPATADEDAATPTSRQGQKTNRWGNRGVSISADDTLADSDRARFQDHLTRAGHGGNASTIHAPAEDGDAFLDDEDEDAPILSHAGDEVLNSDTEWRESTPDRK